MQCCFNLKCIQDEPRKQAKCTSNSPKRDVMLAATEARLASVLALVRTIPAPLPRGPSSQPP